MWFEAKRDWCCAHHGAGCPTTTSTTTSKTTTTATTTTQTSTTTTRTTSTSTGTRTTTTSTKTSSTTTTTTATSSTSTSSTSRTSTTRTTMTSAHYDCTLELNWEHGWSQAKKDWCCASIGSGCSSTATTTTTTTPAAPLPRAAAPQDTSADFDCTEGFLDAKEWPQEKRTWCCTTVGWGCEGDAPPSSTAASVQDDNSKYDCDVQYLTWDVDWSEGKKEWCCRVVGWGCQASRALVQKFERRAHGPGAGRLSGRPLLALAGACCLALALAAGVICAVRAARANDLAGRGSYVSVPARAGRGRLGGLQPWKCRGRELWGVFPSSCGWESTKVWRRSGSAPGILAV
ncbi:unnamed protein product [Prorocentrum cordatum]|uniref:Cellulase n=1 Tax=Prorocentrum cordatum TaxID=2364126 RepID=A0ABN9TCW8_9DINO|nr:unnamed protein product [Polarella glacialis]